MTRRKGKRCGYGYAAVISCRHENGNSVVLTCLRPEEVPHFREIIRKYNNCEQNVKVFAQKLIELLGPNRKKRLSYLKHVLRAEDMRQFDNAIQS
uniref:Uncharacterized protein n=1 Tax=Caenorhabditis japonica TaxID=281687 RepID=A0A8R1IAX4_CAEJA